jgi:hypothetical protein
MKYSEFASTALIAALAVSMGAAPAVAKAGGSAKAKTTVRAASVKPTAATAPRAKTASTPRLKTNGSATANSSARTARPTLTNAKPTAARPTLTSAQPTSRPTTNAKPSKPTPTNAQPDGRPTTNNAPPAPVPTIIPLNKAQQLLAKNTNLRMKLQSRLPVGMDVMAAASGFPNLGQFVAAVNVSSKNPDINFLNLKNLMIGDSPMSLGQAVQQIKGLNAAAADSIANTARVQANADIAASSPTPARKVKTKS